MTVAVLTAMRSPPPLATSSDNTMVGNRAGAGVCTTASLTVSVANGQGPFTILWTGASGVAATHGTSFTTAFSGTISAGETKSVVIVGTVTDARNETSVVSIDVTLVDIAS